ncbi:MAG: Phosphoglucosamine mutase [Candidatus Saccharibacteria bacterium GW2011_GWA2_46_10]|nr:MAG: Phosphoglucosamine mutase [Candidatus Saccharibacteria bacterium GW2011_GWA2_46_10]
MGRELFGTDGIRAEADKYPLDKPTVVTIGKAVGLHFSEPGEYILLANDTRESSPEIVGALSEGIRAMGTNVKLVGGIPTPGVAYLTANSDAAAGIMVTASHNPANYNGIKVFARGGKKLTNQQENELNASIIKGVASRGKGDVEESPALKKEYEDFLVNSAKGASFSGLKIAIDTANGAATDIAESVFTKLGAKVTPMFNKPDGYNINQECGALHPEALIKEVTTKSLDIGIALDGDADRVLLIDKNGEEVKGDYMLYILAVAGGYKDVVATVMSNHGFETALSQKGIRLHRTKVGDRYILEELDRLSLSLGGEQSGHIIISNLLATGDGMLAAIQTLKAIQSSGKSLSEWCQEITLVPQATLNVKLDNKHQVDEKNYC